MSIGIEDFVNVLALAMERKHKPATISIDESKTLSLPRLPKHLVASWESECTSRPRQSTLPERVALPNKVLDYEEFRQS